MRLIRDNETKEVKLNTKHKGHMTAKTLTLIQDILKYKRYIEEDGLEKARKTNVSNYTK